MCYVVQLHVISRTVHKLHVKLLDNKITENFNLLFG